MLYRSPTLIKLQLITASQSDPPTPPHPPQSKMGGGGGGLLEAEKTALMGGGGSKFVSIRGWVGKMGRGGVCI